MPEAKYEDFYPTDPKTSLSRAEAEEYGKYHPDSAPPKTEPDKPDALTALSMALEAVRDGRPFTLPDTGLTPAAELALEDMLATRAMVPDRNAPSADLDPEYRKYNPNKKEENK